MPPKSISELIFEKLEQHLNEKKDIFDPIIQSLMDNLRSEKPIKKEIERIIKGESSENT
ncbi:MAG: hypothetical protein WC645_07425 [Candidatus Margulisiibacteriota bacterium]